MELEKERICPNGYVVSLFSVVHSFFMLTLMEKMNGAMAKNDKRMDSIEFCREERGE
jgi:hypothetical protein